MSWNIIGTLLRKDFMLYFRNRFFAFVTILALVFYILIYLVMPQTVDESLSIAVYAPSIPPIVLNFLSDNDLTIQSFDSDEALQAAVTTGEYPVGIVLSGDFLTSILGGQPTSLRAYFSSNTPVEINDAMRTVLRNAFNELSYSLSGSPLNVTFEEEVLGPDMLGQQIAMRDRMLPLFASFLLLVETMGLGSLISEEVERRTLQAVLTTPARVLDVFTSKAILGIGLALVQAVALMALTNTLRANVPLLLVTLLLGSILVTGIAFLIASAARDLMAVLGWGILVILVLSIPSFGVIFPGTVSEWVKAIPSFYLVDTIHRVVNFSADWNAVGPNLLALLAFSVVIFGLGVLALERKFR